MLEQSPVQSYDVIIVGAGMVGAALACALAAGSSHGRRIAVLESAPIEAGDTPYQPSFDARSTALSAGSVDSLQQLGLWQTLRRQAAPIKHIHVSDRGRFGATRLRASEHGLEALGQVVENQWLGRVMNDALLNLPGLDLYTSSRVRTVQAQQPGYALTVDTTSGPTRRLQTGLLVLAEGGRSGLCKQLGIHRRHKDYQQVALVANVTTSCAHAGMAYERFTEQGPLALLPLPPFERRSRCALIWAHPAAAELELRAQSDEQLLSSLQQAFGSRLGRFQQVGERLYWPLGLTLAEEQYRPGLVLLGNSAHALHPVAGQGFNLALRSAMRLAEHIKLAWQKQQDPGTEQHLRNFVSATRADQQRTIFFSDQLISLFGATDPYRRTGRGLGLVGMDLLPFLKRSFARQAMGMGPGHSRGVSER